MRLPFIRAICHALSLKKAASEGHRVGFQPNLMTFLAHVVPLGCGSMPVTIINRILVTIGTLGMISTIRTDADGRILLGNFGRG